MNAATLDTLAEQLCAYLESQGAGVDFIHDHLNDHDDFGVEFVCDSGVDGVIQYRTQDGSYYESIDGDEAVYPTFEALCAAWEHGA